MPYSRRIANVVVLTNPHLGPIATRSHNTKLLNDSRRKRLRVFQKHVCYTQLDDLNFCCCLPGDEKYAEHQGTCRIWSGVILSFCHKSSNIQHRAREETYSPEYKPLAHASASHSSPQPQLKGVYEPSQLSIRLGGELSSPLPLIRGLCFGQNHLLTKTSDRWKHASFFDRQMFSHMLSPSLFQSARAASSYPARVSRAAPPLAH
jgi:hypothetical protein